MSYQTRLKNIEELLTPKITTSVIIDYITSEPESYIMINGEKNIIPTGINVKEFIDQKIKLHKGVITCAVYLAKNLTKGSATDFSKILPKSNVTLTVMGYEGAKK